jgi:hypothetical protein
VDVGVVRGAAGLAEPELEVGGELVPRPVAVQVGGGVDDAALDHPREATRDAIELTEPPGDLDGRREDVGRDGRPRGLDADALGERSPRQVEDVALDCGPADVDAQGSHGRARNLPPMGSRGVGATLRYVGRRRHLRTRDRLYSAAALD